MNASKRNSRKIWAMGLVLAAALCLTGCGREKPLHMGVNARILSIDSENRLLHVEALDDDSILGEECYIDCSRPETYFIQALSEDDVRDLEFEDLSAGDSITVDVYEVVDGQAWTPRVQLLNGP